VKHKFVAVTALAVIVALLSYAGATALGPRGGDRSEPADGLVSPTLTPGQAGRNFQPGEPWDGRGRGNLRQSDLESFSAYELFWVGPSFGGYNLQSASRITYDAPRGATPARMDQVIFSYGACIPTSPEGGRPSCPVPFYIDVHPVCFVRPEQVAGARGQPTTVRGGALMRVAGGGEVLVWTGNAFVSIGGADLEVVGQAVARLEALSPSGPRAGQALEPPDFSACPAPAKGMPTPMPPNR
jgi:hypothetical protein